MSFSTREPPKFDWNAYLDAGKIANAFTSLGPDAILLRQLPDVTATALAKFQEVLATPPPARNADLVKFEEDRLRAAHDFWDAWWKNTTSDLREELWKNASVLSRRVPGTHTTLVGSGLLDSSDVRNNIFYERMIAQNQLGAQVVHGFQANTSVPQTRVPGLVVGKLPLSKKPARSQFHFIVNLNRRANIDTDVRSIQTSALYNAFDKSIQETLTELRGYGVHMYAWLDSKKHNLRGVPVPWDNETIKDCKTAYRIEVGPSNGYMHAHIYVGIEHRIRVRVNTPSFKAAILNRMNGFLTSGNPRYNFGVPLTNIFVSKPSVIHQPSLDEGLKDFINYVEKEDKELRDHLEKLKTPVVEAPSRHTYFNEQANVLGKRDFAEEEVTDEYLEELLRNRKRARRS